MKQVELLSPAGDFNSLKAAVAGGCNAVYLGLKKFSARNLAANFSRDEFLSAVNYCHIRDVKVYVAMNTVLNETEIEAAIDDVRFLYDNDADGLIIQDPGLFHLVRRCWPDFPVHCSTQMHIHNLAGVKFMKEEGAKRVVLARETPLDIIRQACLTGMDIEVFVYGSVCISYSGQCLMSSAMKNRSANRGICAQCCRLKYFPEEGGSFPKGDYLLSPKDLNVIDKLPLLIDAGVSSLKIEGRMKKPEYVYLTTKTFRQAIDAYYENRPYKITQRRQKELSLLFNRGFSQGHMFNAKFEERMNPYRPNHLGIETGYVISYKNGKVTVKLTDYLGQNDGLRILCPDGDIGLTAVKIEKNGKLVKEAFAGETVTLLCHSMNSPARGMKLIKTTEKKLMDTLDKEIAVPKRIPVSVIYEGRPEEPFRISLSDTSGNKVEACSETICQKAVKAPLTNTEIEKHIAKISNTPYKILSIRGKTDNIFISISAINSTRRDAFNKLDKLRRLKNRDRNGKLPYKAEVRAVPKMSKRLLIETLKDINYAGNEVLFVREGENLLPVVNQASENKEVHKSKVLSNLGDLYGELAGCIAGMTLNIANSYACAYFMEKKGIESVIFSSELTNEEIALTLSAYRNRYGHDLNAYRLVYGKRVLMYIKDALSMQRNIKTILDLPGNRYEIEYNNGITRIRQPQPYVSSNPYCGGSYLIMKDMEKEIIEEAYEELHQRV